MKTSAIHFGLVVRP